MSETEDAAKRRIDERRAEFAREIDRGGEDRLKQLFAPFSVIPEEHSLAKGTAPAGVKGAFEGWTSTFKNTRPVVMVYFPEGVPSLVAMRSPGKMGLLPLLARGLETAAEAEYWARQIAEAGGCGFAIFAGIHCYHGARCVPSLAQKRCLHMIPSSNFSEQDAERGYLYWKDQIQREGLTAPNERWNMTGDQPRRL